MKFTIEVSTESNDENIREKCLTAVAGVLIKDGAYFGIGYPVEESKDEETEDEKVYHWDGNDTCHYEDIMEILRGLQGNEKYSQKAITADIDWLHHISTTIKNNN